ncbi:MAG: hypothetical protein R3B09_12240 [Nannocystaceae bacterium]
MTSSRIVSVVAAGSLALSLSACRGLDRTYDCPTQGEKFMKAVAEEEFELLPEITDTGNFTMGMMISEDGINRLLSGIVGAKIPFASEMQLGPTLVHFEPTTTPVIDVANLPECGQCVLFSLDFDFDVTQGDSGVTTGLGSAFLSIPIYLQDKEDGSVALIAAYEQATVNQMDLNVNGFDSKDHEAISGALALLATDTVREQYGPTEMLSMGTIEIGNGSVKAKTRRLFVVPELDAIVLGMETNVPLPTGAGLNQPDKLPEGIPMAILFDPNLILAISQRMIAEGEIPRRYGDDGMANPDGPYGVTLWGMQASSLADNRLDTDFRVWRTDGEFCGFADLEMPMELLVDTSQRIGVNALKPEIIGGEGVGELAEDHKELIDKNQQLLDTFKAALADQVGLTVNYRQIGVEGSTIFFDPKTIKVTSDAIAVLIDFVVAAEE